MAQRGAMPPNNAAGPSGGTLTVVRLTEDRNAWNVDGSSDAVSVSGSHGRDHEDATGVRPGVCAYKGCSNRAEVGGHLWLPGRGFGVFVAPICRPCNDPDNKARWMGGGSRVPAGLLLTKVQKTSGMRQAMRRVEGPRARRSGAAARAPVNPAPAPLAAHFI